MKTGFLNSPDDVQWLNDTHLKGVALPTDWKLFQSFVLQGNEDCPHAVNLYLSQDPLYQDQFYRVRFANDDPMVYAECCLYDGATNAPLGGLSRID